MRSSPLAILPLLLLGLVVQAAAQAPDGDALLASVMRGGAMPAGVARLAGGDLLLEGPGYRARARPDGVAIEVEPPVAGSEVPSLELRFESASRDGVTLAVADQSLPFDAGTTAAYARGPLVERYEARQGDLEQTFEIPEPLEGTGDLVIRLAVSGNVSAEATAAPRHGAISFSWQEIAAIRYGEAFVFDHAGRRAEVLTDYDGAGGLRLVVPAAFLENATWPVVVDPVIGSEFNPGGPDYNDLDPEVAHDPQQRTFLVTWNRIFNNVGSIRAALYDHDGNAITTLIGVESTADDCRNPSVAYFSGAGNTANNRFLIAWQQSADSGTTFDIQARLVDADDGALSAPAFAVTSGPAGMKHEHPAVSGGPPMMVAYQRTDVGATVPTSIRCRAIYWQSLASPSGEVVEPERLLEEVTTGHVQHPRLAQSRLNFAFGGNQWSLWRAVWERFYISPAPGDYDVRTASFRTRSGGTTAFALHNGPTGVIGAGSVGPQEMYPDIGLMAPDLNSASVARYLIVWQDDNDVRGFLYDVDTYVGTEIAIQTSAAGQYRPVVGAGYCEYTVAYLEAGTGEFNIDVYAARVLADGTVGANHRLVSDPGSQYQDHVSASSRPVTFDASLQRNTTLLAWWGQVGPPSSLNDLRARFFEPVAGVANFFGTACAGPGGTVPQIGYFGGLPHLGNPSFGIALTGAPPSVPATLVLGLTGITLAIPGTSGCYAYVGPEYIIFPTTTTSSSGTILVPIPIPCHSILEGDFVACQWLIDAPGFNTFGYVTSNDVDLTWHE